MHRHILLMLILAFAFIGIVHSQTTNSLGITSFAVQNAFTTNDFSFSCNPILMATQISKSGLLSIINDTKIENEFGACSLAALNYYNSSGVLAIDNVSINMTKLANNFINKNPNITAVSSNNITSAFSIRPNILCIVTPAFQSSALSDSNKPNISRSLNCVAIPESQAFDCNSVNADYSYNNSLRIPNYFEDNFSLSANSTNETDPDDMGYININQPQSALGNSGWSATIIRAACNNLYPTQINPSGETNSCGRVFGAFAYGYIPIGIYTVNPITSSSSWQYVGYSASGTRQPITGDAPNYPASVGYAQMSYGPYTNRITAQWARVRNAPPNGIMPAASGSGII